eukprot:RCo017940
MHSCSHGLHGGRVSRGVGVDGSFYPAGNDAGCPGKATPQLRGAPPAPRAGWRMDHKLLPGVQGEAEVQEESQGPSSVGHGVSRHSLRRATRILVLRAMVEDLQKEMQCRRMSEIEKM